MKFSYMDLDLDFLKSKIRSVPDWPKRGVVFRDITPVLEDKQLFRFLIDELAGLANDCSKSIDKIIGIDARGFIMASALAYKLETGLVIVRKKGKLPAETIGKAYSLEYAACTIEMHRNSIAEGERVLLVDDILATGGTMSAAIDIVKELKGEIVGVLFCMELDALGGREKLKAQNIKSLIHF